MVLVVCVSEDYCDCESNRARVTDSGLELGDSTLVFLISNN